MKHGTEIIQYLTNKYFKESVQNLIPIYLMALRITMHLNI
jgi:hypothetical protein